MIIGITGFARSGKDSVASTLLARGYSRRAFADKLREALWRLNPVIIDGQDVHELVHQYGWEQAKVIFPEIRRLLQVLGTEVGRQMIHEDVWVKAATHDLEPGDKVVFTDVRFPNEAASIKALGGTIWRVERPGVEAINAHPSETAMNSWNFDKVIVNDGDLSDLNEQVLAALNESAPH